MQAFAKQSLHVIGKDFQFLYLSQAHFHQGAQNLLVPECGSFLLDAVSLHAALL